MAKANTFFLRTTVDTSSTNYQSSDIDISAYVSPPQGKVLVCDRGFITFSTDGNGPIIAGDVVSSGTGSRNCGAQVTTESQTGLVAATDNSLFMQVNLYAAVNPAGALSTLTEQNAMNPALFKDGFIVPTDKIHCGVDTGAAWNAEIRIGFIFEVHTEKLSLSRIQELLVSLTAN